MSGPRSGDRLGQLVAALAPHVDNVVAYHSVDSTHRAALRILVQTEDEELPLAPTAVVALRQSAGVGRGDRRWISPEGGLFLDWTRSGIRTEVVQHLPMLAGAAAHLALTRLEAPGLGLKWPNDILADGRKLAGVVVHVRHGSRLAVAVGLGVNLALAPTLDDDSAQPAAALAELLPPPSGDPFADWAPGLAADFVARLAAALEDPEPAISHWRRVMIHRPGETMRVRLSSGVGLEGRFLGFTREGFLRLELAEGERTISGGDVLG